MRKSIVAANWKMNTQLKEALALAIKIKNSLLSLKLVDIVLCPPFVYLSEIKKIFESTVINLGAQDVWWKDKGAYTGEISPVQLADFCRYVIIGHSERRQFFAETDDLVNKKTKVSLKAGLIPIICVGETLEAWRKGDVDLVLDQVKKALAGVNPKLASKIIIAYEPVWAIGTANPASASYANQICLRIRQMIDSLYGREVALKIRILYGGSVNKSNAAGFVEESEIDGLLIGGASLIADEFISIVRDISKVKT